MWYLDVLKNKITECEIIADPKARPLAKIREIETGKTKFIPDAHKVFETKDELLVSLFTFLGNRFDAQMVMDKYSLTKVETKRCLELAQDQNPQKFI